MEGEKITLLTKTNSNLATLTNLFNMTISLKNIDYISSFVGTLIVLIISSVKYNQIKDNKNFSKKYKNYLISTISILIILYIGLLFIFTMYPSTYNYLSNLNSYLPCPLFIIITLTYTILLIVHISLFI